MQPGMGVWRTALHGGPPAPPRDAAHPWPAGEGGSCAARTPHSQKPAGLWPSPAPALPHAVGGSCCPASYCTALRGLSLHRYQSRGPGRPRSAGHCIGAMAAAPRKRERAAAGGWGGCAPAPTHQPCSARQPRRSTATCHAGGPPRPLVTCARPMPSKQRVSGRTAGGGGICNPALVHPPPCGSGGLIESDACSGQHAAGAASECARADGARRGGRAPANASSPTGARLQGSCTLLSAPGRPARPAHPKPHSLVTITIARPPPGTAPRRLIWTPRDRRSSARPALARLPHELPCYSASSRWVAHRGATRQGVARLAVFALLCMQPHPPARPTPPLPCTLCRPPHTLPCTSCPPCLQIDTSVHS